MPAERSLIVYFVIGEESGDVLGANLLSNLQLQAAEQNMSLNPHGLAGTAMRGLGMSSLFDINDIAVMGFSDVIVRLPKIISRIFQTAKDIVHVKPDIVVLIDSPDFTHAVARRVRKKLPDVPIVNYVCPSVWAWRKYRARKMVAYIDHVLTLLPFEPAKLAELGGPPATYVGHPLAENLVGGKGPSRTVEGVPKLLLLPGSRKGEISRHMPIIGETLKTLRDRGLVLNPVVLAAPNQEAFIEQCVESWAVKPLVLTGEAGREEAFATAHVALAASGTVTLELAVAKIPMVSMYLLDPVARRLTFLIEIWTASLPNLIADYVVVPEDHDENVWPDRLARQLERLFGDSHERRAQLAGFDVVAKNMAVAIPAGETAARLVLETARYSRL